MILIVDDDPLQAHLTISLLGNDFGELHRAIDATEALCLLEQPLFRLKLALVITGHHAHGFGGAAFVNELHARLPEVPVLILGMKGESASEYTGENVTFFAHPVLAQQVLEFARKKVLIAKRGTA